VNEASGPVILSSKGPTRKPSAARSNLPIHYVSMRTRRVFALGEPLGQE